VLKICRKQLKRREKAFKNVKGVVGNLKEKGEEVVENLKEGVEELGETILQKGEQVIQNVKERGQDILGKGELLYETAKEKVKTYVEEEKQEMKHKADTLKKKVKETGQNIAKNVQFIKDLHSLPKSGGIFYNRAHELLFHLQPRLFASKEDKQKIERIQLEVMESLHDLFEEEHKLLDTINRRNNLKKGLWLLDSSERMNVAELQTEVDFIDTVLHSIYNSIQEKVNDAKPIIGPYSWLCIRDIFSFLIHIINFTTNAISYFLTLSFIEFMVYSPFLLCCIWGVLLVYKRYYTIYPVVVGVLTLIWVFRLPFVIMQYNPNFYEFLSLFLGGLVLDGVVLFFLKRAHDEMHVSKRTTSLENQIKSEQKIIKVE